LTSLDEQSLLLCPNVSDRHVETVELARCLFAVAASDARISTAEEAEVHRITNQLRIERADLTQIRLQYKKALPGIT
jgi:uncharacterized tellurite resistance protein B-like protein